MARERWQTIYKTRNEHKCYDCGLTIFKGSVCSYGVTTDRDVCRNGRGIEFGYFCTSCRDPIKNIGAEKMHFTD